MIRPMPTLTNTDGAPSWVRDHIEGLDWSAYKRWDAEFEAEIPGVTRIFEGLIDAIPSQDEHSEFPIAAAVVDINEYGAAQVIASSLNMVNALGLSSAHAEREAIDESSIITGSKHLHGAWLLSTLQPCVSCSGLAIDAGLKGVIYGARHQDVQDRHVKVSGEYKKFRTTPNGFDTDELLRQSGLLVVGGFMAEQVLAKTVGRVHGSWSSYYSDPDV